MRETVSKYVQNIADALVAGDASSLGRFYRYPLAVFMNDSISIELNEEASVKIFYDRRETLLRSGVKDIETRVLEVKEETDGRLRVTADWNFLTESRRVIAQNKLRYFCRVETDGELTIEIIEFLERNMGSMPDLMESVSRLH
ncbi:MAG: hypothetical protein KJO42_10475 [Silicimonas sp.]|nr:hypothetical protein [Silicimonas sp.]